MQAERDAKRERSRRERGRLLYPYASPCCASYTCVVRSSVKLRACLRLTKPNTKPCLPVNLISFLGASSVRGTHNKQEPLSPLDFECTSATAVRATINQAPLTKDNAERAWELPEGKAMPSPMTAAAGDRSIWSQDPKYESEWFRSGGDLYQGIDGIHGLTDIDRKVISGQWLCLL